MIHNFHDMINNKIHVIITIGLQNNDTAESLLQPFERGPALEYTALRADSDGNVTISWSYHPKSTTSASCSSVERYDISVYPSSVVHAATSRRNLSVPRETLSSTENHINISRELLDGNYLQISAIHHGDCNLSVTTAPYLHGYSPNGKCHEWIMIFMKASHMIMNCFS